MIEHYFPYIVLFLIISRLRLSYKEEERLIKVCYFLIILQIPVVLAQYFLGGYSNPDSMSGTIGSGLLGGTGINGVLGAFLFSVCMAKIMLTKVTPGYLILGVMAFVPSIFGGSKFGVLLMGVAVVVLLFSLGWARNDLKAKKMIKYAVILFGFAIFVLGVFVFLIPKERFAEFENFRLLMDPRAVLAYDADPGSRRIVGYVYLVKYIFKGLGDILFGLGPGATLGSKEFGVPPNKLYVHYFPLGAPDSISFMATIGIIGLVLVMIIIFYGLVWVRNYLKIETCPFMKMTGFAFIAITVAFLISIGYSVVWSSQVGLTYWVLAGVLLKRFDELREREVEASSF